MLGAYVQFHILSGILRSPYLRELCSSTIYHVRVTEGKREFRFTISYHLKDF